MYHLTGYPGGAPSELGGTWPDFMIGVVMAYAVLSALHYRHRTGKGQYIDLAMAEVVMSMLPEGFADYNMNGRDRGRRGNREIGRASWRGRGGEFGVEDTSIEEQ